MVSGILMCRWLPPLPSITVKWQKQKTGEGKTLSAIPALYLNALTGNGVHLVTVNDYLARRDAGWMGPIFHLLGMSTSAMISEQSFMYDPAFEDPTATDGRLKHLRSITRKEAYKADVTYGINSEYGFDYLATTWFQTFPRLCNGLSLRPWLTRLTRPYWWSTYPPHNLRTGYRGNPCILRLRKIVENFRGTRTLWLMRNSGPHT